MCVGPRQLTASRNCIVTFNFRLIHANCSDTHSASSGLQVIVQLSNASEVQKLYSNQSMDPHTPVTVEVERDGLYQVTIFPIREGRGILDSTAVYSRLLVVDRNTNADIFTLSDTLGKYIHTYVRTYLEHS